MERLDPEVALGPDRRDATRLLGCWLVRRAAFGLFFLGLLVGVVVAGVQHQHAEVFLDPSSTDDVFGGVLSAFGLVFVAILVRFAVRWYALGLAWPLARAHQGELGGAAHRRLEQAYDRFCVARAFRELRWTEGVLDAAEARLGAHAATYARADRAIRLLNIAVVAVLVVAVGLFGLTIEV